MKRQLQRSVTAWMVILTATMTATIAATLVTQAAKPAARKSARSSRPSTKLPVNVTRKLDIVYARIGTRELHLDLFSPKGNHAKCACIVVVHGGGWLKGDKSTFRALGQALATRGYVTAAIEYRLGGEARFPAGIQDCNAAVRFLRAHAEQYGIDPERIGAVGGSAGGHLVGLMATAPHIKDFQGDGGNSRQSSVLQAAVVMAGPLELTTGPVADRSRKFPKRSNANRWLGKTIDEAPELYRTASPITYVSRKTPPILFMAGELDHPERNAATRKKLKALGIETGIYVVKGARHGCWNRHPWFTPMVNRMDDFFSRTLHRQ